MLQPSLAEGDEICGKARQFRQSILRETQLFSKSAEHYSKSFFYARLVTYNGNGGVRILGYLVTDFRTLKGFRKLIWEITKPK